MTIRTHSPTGLVLYHGIEAGEELAGYARSAEKAGFDSLWVTERYFHEETFSMLGYLAASTSRMDLGVGVINPFTRSPALAAMGAATLARLSGGRVILGLGRSERRIVEDRLGTSYAGSMDALRDAVGSIRSLLRGQEVAAWGPKTGSTGRSRAQCPAENLSRGDWTAGPGPCRQRGGWSDPQCIRPFGIRSVGGRTGAQGG